MSEEIPSGRFRRTGRIGAVVAAEAAKVAGSTAAAAVRSDADAERVMQTHIDAAENVAKLLGTMKGAAMKVGQLVSFLELDLVPEEYRPVYQQAMATLRDAAPPLEWKAIEKTLKKELDEPIGLVFAEIDHTPAAAASIGQVHRARLEDGREVAVKVQYPGVAEAVHADLQNVGLIVRAVKLIAPRIDAGAIAQEVRERVGEELDYEWEAQAQRRFGRAYRGHPFIHIPGVVTELSTTRVLVSEWVDGIGFDAIKALGDDERQRFAEMVFRFYYGELHRVGAFNADPHPGNYMLMADGRGAFLDFGSVMEIGRERLDKSVELLLAFGKRDTATVDRLLVELGYFRKQGEVSAERLIEIISASSGWFLEDGEVAMTPELVAETLAAGADPRAGYFDVLRKANLPREDVLRMRLDASIIAVLGQLRATRNWHRIALEYWIGGEPETELGRLEREWWPAS